MFNKQKNTKVMSRKYVLKFLGMILLFGALFGFFIYLGLVAMNVVSMQNLSLCMIACSIFCLVFWAPLMVPTQQIAEIKENSIAIMPRSKDLKKVKIIWYALINNHIEPFYHTIQLQDIESVTFSYQAHWGSYGFQRFSYYLTMYVGNKKIKVFMNPMQNGFLLPSGYGIPFCNTFSKEDMVNVITYFESNKIVVHDPNQLVNAMKDKNTIMYDYLVSLNKKVKY